MSIKTAAKAQASPPLGRLLLEYSDKEVYCLLRIKVNDLKSYAAGAKALLRLKILRRYARSTSCKGIQKGWSSLGGKTTGRECCDEVYYGMSSSMLVKLDLLIDGIRLGLLRILLQGRRRRIALQRSRLLAKKSSVIGVDRGLLNALWCALQEKPFTSGYIYFKKWALPGDNIWFKIGVTSDPARRDAEQNVLPVPCEIIACVDVGSMDKARFLERVIHDVLGEYRVKDAGNRELFRLSHLQASAVRAVLLDISQG